ncbi:PREDICTED: uncharacterized protein LOC108616271 [Drosophila arizonae]|uniref:Uncharacterized protein LOC108616271 n=1 Tax=Drosophila arizonae TaxID=7263 RepID=A0ABM1PI16_DROAR|nr:PREDICTED: uncharacterized protein LOC108616271 [Drosophila arizonae]
MKQLELSLLCLCLCLLIGPLWAADTPTWQLPTAQAAQRIQRSCQKSSAGQRASQLRCLVEQLGLWTDEQGYNARRIAKIFAGHQQTEELMLVVEYCNDRERRLQQKPAQWAYAAYKCATAGTLGQWLREYKRQMQAIK